MRIIHSYILRDFFAAFILAVFILIFVMMLGNIMIMVSLIVTKGVPLSTIARLLMYSLPTSIQFIIPIAITAALLLSLGRLSSDNEIVTIRASGMSMRKIIMPFFVLGVIFTLIMLIVNDRVTPYAHFKHREILKEVGSENPTAMLEPGVFINAFDKYIIFVYEISGNRFRNIRIYEPMGDDMPPRTIIAKRGEFITLPDRNILKLKLIDGAADEIDPKNPRNFYKINFHTYFMTLNFAENTQHVINKKAKDMTLRELWNKMQELRAQRIDADPIAAQFHKRIALSFSPLVFFFLGIPLGIITKRREKAANMAFAFMTVGIYFILMLCVDALSKQGNLAPSSGMWIPNIIFGLLGVVLTVKLCVF